MKVTVDKTMCVGCRLCSDTCPDVFVMVGDVAEVVKNKVSLDIEDDIREAAEYCPVNAISVED